MGLSDTFAQLVIEKKRLDDWDAGRTLKLGALGLVFTASLVRRWYLFLESKVPKELPVVRRGFRKMLLDQLVFAPPFTLLMSCLVPLVNGESTEQIIRRVRNSYITIFGLTCLVWQMAQFINFTYVPLRYQVIYAQVVALVWNFYVSVMLNKKE